MGGQLNYHSMVKRRKRKTTSKRIHSRYSQIATGTEHFSAGLRYRTKDSNRFESILDRRQAFKILKLFQIRRDEPRER